MSPRAAITAVFFVDGALYSSWVSRIPALSDHIHASTGALGLVLLAPALAAALTMPQVGRALPRSSSAVLCRGSLLLLCGAVILPALAPSTWTLGLVLLALGASNSALDVSMNAQGVAVERHLGRPMFSSLHAAFSFGGFAGAGAGALAAALGLSPLPHLALAAVIFGVPGLLAARTLHEDDADPDVHAPALRWRALPGRLVILGFACFFGLLAEGGAADWSAKLVRGEPHGSAALGALGYAAFSIGMAAGRLGADSLGSRWGATALLRGGAGIAALGFGAALGVDRAPVTIAGFLVLGLGLSGVVPTLFRAAADSPGVATGPGIAAVSSLGYLGFLAGPPIIGGVAQISSLELACGLLVLAVVIVALLAGRADTGRPRRPVARDEVLT